VRVLIDYRPALREPSGVGEYTHQLVTALLAAYPPDARASELALFLFSSSWKDRVAPAAELTGAAIIDRRIPVRLLNLSWHRLGWPPAEMLAGRDFDVAHSLHPLLMPSRSAAQVVTIHDLNFLAHPERTRAEIRRDYPALARDHASRADAILVNSAFTAGEVERALGVPRDRIAVCPPGAPDWTPREAMPKDGYVLFFGTLEPRKNVSGLLDAYELLINGTNGTAKAVPYDPTYDWTIGGRPFRSAGNDTTHARREDAGPDDVARPFSRAGRDDATDVGRPFRGAGPLGVPELVLAGKATDEARPWLERLERPPLKGVVRYAGYVDRAERQALYQGARLLVQPSFEEGFGMPVLEAMSLGVPVVAANRGSLPEVLGDAGTLVDPERPDDIANAIARLLADDAYAATCASRGLARARTFSWERTAHRVYEMYRQAIERRARKPRR
jgi:glycosyltransferase involved in cell wall biosynthesis